MHSCHVEAVTGLIGRAEVISIYIYIYIDIYILLL